MNKLKLTFLSSLFALTSCGPANSGLITYSSDAYCKNRATLSNRSTSEKITFIIEDTKLINGKPDTIKYEQTVAPQKEMPLGCCDDQYDAHEKMRLTNMGYRIVGAYVVTTP